MTTRLIPPRYRCRTHDRDLTDEVRGKVDHEPVVTSNLNWWPTGTAVVVGGAFEVDVHCPDGGDGGHEIRFMGSFER